MNSTTDDRLQLLANGYSPIRNRDKRTFLKDWPGLELTEELIRSWDRMSRDKATGIRIEDGLCAIDFDINDDAAMKEIANAIFERVDAIGDETNGAVLFRRGKGAKEAWFVRTSEEFGRLHSRAWTRPGESVDAGAHRVEIFGGSSPRQFGALGPHTVADDGTVEVLYGYPERSPLDTRKSELAELTKQELFQIVDIVEEVLERLGWSVVEQSTKGENHARRVYDLTEEMHFDLDTGERVPLQRLRELASADGGLRCSAAFVDVTGKRTDRCLVTLTRTGNLAIWDSAHDLTHCEASLKPIDLKPDINRVMERLQESKDARRYSIKSGDDAIKVAGKLMATYGYCPHQQQDVVPLWAKSMDDGIPLAKLRVLMLPYCTEEVGPRGGITRINPVDLWTAHDQRVQVRGLRMRPDQPRPTYEDAGEVYVNIYAPPVHVGAEAGSALGGQLLLEQLLPNALERQWFTRWLAHKLRFPHIPGPGVVMVARSFGTGRGTLAELIKRLFGPRYVRQLPFSLFAGKTYQAQYNEWQADALMVIVNESSESEGSTYQTKRNTYEHLKELVDPAPTEREIVVKSRPNYRALSFTSYIIATNHEDALPIPADDRRFAVLTNGEPRDEEFWNDVRDWMESDANVAAFYEWMMTEVDLGDYSPFALPPKTEAKAAMVEAGKSDLDRAVEAAIAALHTDAFVVEQLVPLVLRFAKDESLELPQVSTEKLKGLIRKLVARSCYRVGEHNGPNSKLSIEARRYPVWARTPTARKRLSDGPQDAVRLSVLRNGSPAGSGVPGNLHLLPKRE